MLVISDEESRGLSQNVQGPKPSLTQIIFPQDMQFGAIFNKGWRVAMQLHLRFAMSAGDCDWDAKVGFVCSSKDRMAESRSFRVFAAPCMLVPPVMDTLVFAGAGEDVRDDLELDAGGESISEINGPEAEGGARVEEVELEPPEVIFGSCIASGVSCRASVDAKGALLRDEEAM